MRRAWRPLDRPSERTEDTLVRYDLKAMFRSDPEAALLRLEKIARQQPDADLVFALAELSWVEGRRLDRWRRAGAIDRFIDTVAYAYDFLFDPELADPQRAADPRFRQACNLYNGGLERLLRAAQSNGQIMPDGMIRLKTHGKEQVLPVMLTESPWTAADVDQLTIATDYEVSGLPTRNYQYGLGVPLIGVHNTEQPGKEGPERFYPPEMAFPLTAFLVPNSRLRDPAADIAPPRECRLELVDPVRNPVVGHARGVDRGRVRPEHAAGLHVVAHRPRPLSLDRPVPAGRGAGPRQPDAAPPLRVRARSRS